MSHFTVGVITPHKHDYRSALEPYSEVDEEYFNDEGYNPDAKWDWYEVGGRWLSSLKVPKGVESIEGCHYGEPDKVQRGRYRWVDGARIKDILWTDMNRPTDKQITECAKFWDGYVLGKSPDTDFGFVYKPEYYLDRYGTKDNYIMKCNTFCTHDLLIANEDGDTEWLTQGDMGWFGCDASTRESYEEYLEKFYEIIHDPKYQDYWFILIDAHI